ncbi:NADPH-dependent FMN reductase [uncultured Corynebacterium sp.]|uniref:NADPH-dependent FMN reductase n=1 Tax=uncultured Corynebacterium sp. TaxID=159447 RepID=UPI002592C20C|nr:NAD(P)H-dependent oxidoreductase [uncultured Corynebacterium sp.]
MRIGIILGSTREGRIGEPIARWIDSLDGFVFVTPEYNRSAPAPFKNAFDTLGEEWRAKPVAFAGYGYGYGGGVNSVRAWRQIIGAFAMPATENDLSFSLAKEVRDGEFVPGSGQEKNVNAVLGELEALLR